MKTKTVIILAIVLASAFIASTVGAYTMYTWQSNDSFIKITNMLIDTDGVTNYKFTDKVGTSTVTCYGSYSKRITNTGNIIDSNSISCIR